MQHVRTVATEGGPHLAILGAGAWGTQSRERLKTLWRKCTEHLCRALDLVACVTDHTADIQDFSGAPPRFFFRPLTPPLHSYAQAGGGGPLSPGPGQTAWGWPSRRDGIRLVARTKVPRWLKEALARQGDPWKSGTPPRFFFRPLTPPLHSYAQAGAGQTAWGWPSRRDGIRLVARTKVQRRSATATPSTHGDAGLAFPSVGDRLWTVRTPGALRGRPSLWRAQQGGMAYVR